MRFPIKINQNRLPGWLHKYLPSKDDPRKLLLPDSCVDSFDRSITAIKIGDTWKSTQKRRHILSDRLIAEATSSLTRPSFLEIGASAGTTSLELLDIIGDNYDRFYVTDLSFDLKCTKLGNVTYFHHPLTEQCIMRVTDQFLMYEDVEGAVFPLGWIAARMLARAPRIGSANATTVNLLHPKLRQRAFVDPRIVVKEYNVFEPWPSELADIVKVANVLNRLYFSDAEILKALANLKMAMKSDGKLLITDNREIEKVSIFSKDSAGMLVLEKEVNGGTEIADLVERAL